MPGDRPSGCGLPRTYDVPRIFDGEICMRVAISLTIRVLATELLTLRAPQRFLRLHIEENRL
jgi:hypothetical protein